MLKKKSLKFLLILVFVSYHAFHLPSSLSIFPHFLSLQTACNSSSFSAIHGDVVNGGFALLRDSLHGSRRFPPTRTISTITEQFYTDCPTNISFYALVLRSFLRSPYLFVSFAVYARNSNSRISLTRDFRFIRQSCVVSDLDWLFVSVRSLDIGEFLV